eukprot:m.183985 g.183985  ORF g.183985 m.183985 type:complete len:587 (-) comp32174_c0_seq4:148-1908(-)
MASQGLSAEAPVAGTPNSGFKRSFTISSSNPLRHKDTKITAEKRSRFEKLDLEILLEEYKSVAAESAETQTGVEEEEEASDKSPGSEELQWLTITGLDSLVVTHLSGNTITRSDFQHAVRGFMQYQIKAVEKRVDILNSLIRSKPGLRTSVQNEESAPTTVAVAIPENPIRLKRELSRLEGDQQDITKFDDLGDEDQNLLRFLNVVLLTSLFEENNVSVKLQKTTKRNKEKKGHDSNCFGVNLETLVAREKKENIGSTRRQADVPLIFTRILNFLMKRGLTEEGIFRKAGSAARTKVLREKCNAARGDIDFDEINARPHDVAALFKQFLRETPEPLLSSAHLQAFYMTQDLDEKHQQVYALQLLSMQLSQVHRKCLKLLLDFLAMVARNVDKNKMGVSNLAVVFAPSLFFIRGKGGQQIAKEVEMQVSTASALQLLIEKCSTLWRIPPSVLAQLRYIHDQKGGRRTSNAKDVKKLVKMQNRKSGAESFDGASVKNDTVVWSKDKTTATVQFMLGDKMIQLKDLDTKTTVADALQRALKNSPDLASADMFEVGGNIGRRRLHVKGHVLAVFKLNPAARLCVVIPPVS